MNSLWRLELFFKSRQELQDRVIPYLKEKGIKRVNLTNKAKGDQLGDACKAILAAMPSADICVHYSLKWNYRQNVDQSFSDFSCFCASLTGHKRVSVLLVSGGGKKRKLDSVEALRRARGPNIGVSCPPLYVAFNPYFPNSVDAAEERQRLAGKLATGLVCGVYLQMGTDTRRLRQGLDYLKQTVLQQGGKPVEVFGSIFLPSKRLLAQMKYRPWNGVFLSQDYLSSVETAEKITAEILTAYSDHGVIPLLESKISTAAELRHWLDLLQCSSTAC